MFTKLKKRFSKNKILNSIYDALFRDVYNQNSSGQEIVQIEENPFKESEETLDLQLHQLFSYETIQPFNNDKVKNSIILALDKCKILDPACGSGAYPMGVLHKMVHVLQKLDPENIHWKALQKQKAIQETQEAYDLGDKQEREARLIEINDAFDEGINDPDYARKLFLIENCIYGVDIQPVAVQISKLRFFISLVVDQKPTQDVSKNRGIRPLPNLETKFVAANTLIELDKPKAGAQLKAKNLFIDILEKQLSDVRRSHFSAKTPKTKEKWRTKDEKLRYEIKDLLIDDGWNTISANQVAHWDPYKQNISADFFDTEQMFNIHDGFDIVIGNPPYIGQNSNKDIFRKVKETELGKKFHQRRMDYFYFFFHIGIENVKENGIISFITTNYYFNATYADKLRTHISNFCNFLNIVDFNEVKVFDSAQGQHNCISIIQKSKSRKKCKIAFCKKDIIHNENELSNILLNNDKDTLFKTIDSSLIFNLDGNIDFKSKILEGENNIENVLNQMEKLPFRLSTFFDFNQGVVTGCNQITNKHQLGNSKLIDGQGVFIISEEELIALNFNEIESKYIKPWFKNSDVRKYNPITENRNYLIYYTSFNTVNFEQIPNLVNHFSQFKELLINRNIRTGNVTINEYDDFVLGKNKIDYVMIKSSFKDGQYFCISYARNENIFQSPKIICPQRSYENTFAYTDKEWFGASDLYFINHPKNNKNDLKVLVSILNSKLIYWWLFYKGQRKGEMLQLFKEPLNKIPICDFNSKFSRDPFVHLFDIISFLLKKEKIYHYFESILNGLVIQLYFPNHMKEKNIDIAQFVQEDIKAVLGEKDFEKLSDTEKQNSIDELEKRWTSADNEVRNRIKLFAVRSPDILKPILESK